MPGDGRQDLRSGVPAPTVHSRRDPVALVKGASMSDQGVSCSRRTFVGGLSVVGAAGLLGFGADSVAAEPPPETKRIRLVRIPSICRAPQYVADDLLRGQGFTDIE